MLERQSQTPTNHLENDHMNTNEKAIVREMCNVSYVVQSVCFSCARLHTKGHLTLYDFKALFNNVSTRAVFIRLSELKPTV